MSIRNAHWYNLNELRSYPLADSASAISDAGDRLPANILSDMHLRYPQELGRYPYLSSISVTETLVSLTIEAASVADGPSTNLSPVAVFSILKSELVEGRNYPLLGQAQGVGGWIVFGSGVQLAYTGRFGGTSQGLLSPAAAIAYSPLPVKSIGRIHSAAGLRNLVLLRGASPIEIVRGTRTIDGVARDVAVVQLVQPNADFGNPDTNVFNVFAGPCGHRPESYTCDDPQPIEFLNNVEPDCDGNITIRFKGCANIGQVLEQCGVAVDCNLGLAAACLADTLPDDDGKLRNEYDDQCSESLESEADEEALPACPGISQSLGLGGSLPFDEDFSDAVADNWTTLSGTWDFELVTSPATYAYASDLPTRNIAVWQGFDDQTSERVVTAVFRMFLGPSGAKHNAGIVLNLRAHPTICTAYTYYLVEIDYDDMQLRIRRADGKSLVCESSFAAADSLVIGHTHQLVASVGAVDGNGNVPISVTLTDLDDPSIEVTLGPFVASHYLPDTGLMGIHANRAHTQFDSFSIAAL